MIKEITIKFGTELKPTQASWKLQLYRYDHFFKTKFGRQKNGGLVGKTLSFSFYLLFIYFFFWLSLSFHSN